MHEIYESYCIVVGDCGVPLPLNHKICWECAAKKRCKWCKRYLRSARFDDDSEICRACTKRNYTCQSGGGESVKSIFADHFLDGGDIPIDQLIKEKHTEILKILNDELESKR